MRLRAAALALCAAAALPPARPARAAERKPDYALWLETQRQKLPWVEAAASAAGLKPGMTALDVGAGPGLESVRLSELVGPSGRVYASEIDPELVSLIAKQAREHGARNVEPMLVESEWLDPAYGEHRYDVVFLFSVIDLLRHRASYFRQLRDYLNPGAKLVVLDTPGDRLKADQFSFFREDFADWNGFVEAMREAPRGSILREPRSPELQELMNQHRDPADPLLARALLFQLNSLVRGGLLFTRFADGAVFKPGVSFEPEEKPMASWLLYRMSLEGVTRESLFNQLDMRYFGLTEMLNKLLLVQLLRPYLVRPAPYYSRAPEAAWSLDQIVGARRQDLEAAGFRLERLVDLPPYQKLLVFSAAQPEPAPAARPRVETYRLDPDALRPASRQGFGDDYDLFADSSCWVQLAVRRPGGTHPPFRARAQVLSLRLGDARLRQNYGGAASSVAFRNGDLSLWRDPERLVWGATLTSSETVRILVIHAPPAAFAEVPESRAKEQAARPPSRDAGEDRGASETNLRDALAGVPPDAAWARLAALEDRPGDRLVSSLVVASSARDWRAPATTETLWVPLEGRARLEAQGSAWSLEPGTLTRVAPGYAGSFRLSPEKGRFAALVVTVVGSQPLQPSRQ